MYVLTYYLLVGIVLDFVYSRALEIVFNFFQGPPGPPGTAGFPGSPGAKVNMYFYNRI